MTTFIKDIIRYAVLTDDDNKWPTFDGGTLTRSDFVTASEAANCSRRLSFTKQAERDTVSIPDYWDTLSDEEFQARMDAMGDDDKRGIFARGHHMELWVEDRLRAGLEEHEKLICAGKRQLSFYLEGARVSGTPDGMLLDTEARTIKFIEVKSTDNPMSSPRWGHVNQTQVNMGIVDRLIGNYVLGSIQGRYLNDYTVLGGSILYINPSNYLTMQEFWLPYDNGAAVDAAADKAKRLFAADYSITLPEDLPPEGLNQWGGCTFCEFKSLCRYIEELKGQTDTVGKLRALMDGTTPATTRQVPFFSGDAQREDVLRVIADYDKWNKAEKDAEGHKKALKGAIVEWVRKQPGMKAKFEDNGRLFKVSLSQSERVGGFDADALEKFLTDRDEDLKNFRKAPTKTETLLVSVDVTGV